MMEFISQHKIFISAAVIATIFGVWYVSSGGSAAPSSSDTLVTATPANSAAGNGVVEVLLQVRSIKLDGAIFSEPAFRALKDISTQIVPEPIGRPNPFAPLSPSVQPTAAMTRTAHIFTQQSQTSSTKSKK